MFEVLGFTKEQAWDQFGFLLSAFKYKFPSWDRYGLGKLVIFSGKTDSSRASCAFPKVKGTPSVCRAPSQVDRSSFLQTEITSPRKKNKGCFINYQF